MTCRLLTLLALMLVLPSTGKAAAGPGEEMLGGTMVAEQGGERLHFPSLKTDISARIDGDLAEVTVIQIFANPTGRPLNARYLFPLNKDGAVHAMTMEVGDEVITAQIMTRPEATKTFETAKKEGKAASLLTQHRPNMFTQDIANLMPDLPVKVTIKYTQPVPKLDGLHELVIPLVVGPRYTPRADNTLDYLVRAEATSQDAAPLVPRPATVDLNTWSVDPAPDYPPVRGLSIPDTVGAERVSISVELRAGFPIGSLDSATHSLIVSGDERSRTANLADGAVIDNRDFVLRYRLAGKNIQSGFLNHRDGDGGYFSLLIEPPEVPAVDRIVPRELVFVLDTSGSMRGSPLHASKVFMRHALQGLRPGDHFRIIRFGSEASEFADRPVAASPGNVDRGLAFVEGLRAGGGTEVLKAVDRALLPPEMPGVLRIVVFLSDGYVSNEGEILHRIAELARSTRVHTFGIGSAVNRYLLAEMARKGRGYARIVDPTANPVEEAVSLARDIKTPVLTDLHIDWGGLRVSELSPPHIPDLYAGGSVRILGRYSGSGRHRITVHGKVAGKAASLPLEIDLDGVGPSTPRAAIPLSWARARIAYFTDQMLTPNHLKDQALSKDQLETAITDLGLRHSLVTRYTAFVAVSRKVVNDAPHLAKDGQVPLPRIQGVPASAYPKSIQGKQAFAGGSTPEPAEWAALLLLGLFAAYVFRRRGLI